MYRQGDVLLIPCELPKKLGERVEPSAGRIILAYGKATGHHHSICCADVNAWAGDENGVMLLKAVKDTVLTHQEHGAIDIPAGTYRVVRQREYTPEAIRYVAD